MRPRRSRDRAWHHPLERVWCTSIRSWLLLRSSQLRIRRLRSASVRRALEGPLWKGGSAHMDGNKRRPLMMAGLDLGDRYSHLCLIDQHSGEVVEEGRLRTSPEAFER